MLRKVGDAAAYLLTEPTVRTQLRVGWIGDLPVPYNSFRRSVLTRPDPLIQKLSSRRLPGHPPPRQFLRQGPRDLYLDL